MHVHPLLSGPGRTSVSAYARADSTSTSRLRSPYRLARPFIISTLLITLFATYALFVRDPRDSQPVAASPGTLLQPRSSLDRHVAAQLSLSLATASVANVKKDCRAVHSAQDKCFFVRTHCVDDEAGLIPYLTLYYCGFGAIPVAAAARPVAFGLLTFWLGLLFTTIGIAASDFFSVNLSTIASALGLSESLAGVTFLAFGNGSPDVFSTFAAMGSNSGSMAVGELIGAASFITAVIAGSMALVREFRVSSRSFVRDICFFILAISFATLVLADGYLHLWESCCMIAFYVFYVVIVVGGHWITSRRHHRHRHMLRLASHAHLVGGAPDTPNEPLEPYRDSEAADPDRVPSVLDRSPASDLVITDTSTLRQALPRVEVEGTDTLATLEDEDERSMQDVAEVTSNMRANRPRWRRSNTTITPIRPSLVGALEFRATMASLQKARNMGLRPLPATMYSDAPCSHSFSHLEQSPTASLKPPSSPTADPTSRDRSLSSGSHPLHLRNSNLLPERWGRAGSVHTTNLFPEATSPTPAWDGRPPPPPPGDTATAHSSHHLGPPRLQIPSYRRSPSEQSSPSALPFPGFTNSPDVMTLGSHFAARSNPFELSSVSDAQHASDPCFDDSKSIRWWPYWMLPAPHIFFGTFFPTLQGWKEKTLWNRVISIISAPSIFLLTITLPVVENESPHHDHVSADGGNNTANSLLIVDSLGHQQVGSTAELIFSMEQNRAADASVEPETPRQEYRRGSRSGTLDASSTWSRPKSPPAKSHTTGNGTTPSVLVSGPSPIRSPAELASGPDPVGPSGRPSTRSTSLPDLDSLGWNRWLVALQILTGPQFVAFILWAKMYEEVEQPGRLLFQLFLYSLLISLCLLLMLLLTTTAEKKPSLHYLLCFLGFVISVAWISTVAGEVVGVLKAFGVILGISEAILGLTIFAVGNSLGDLVADITVARLGFPVMALAACFGGPMLNILLGIGIGGAWMTIQAANKSHRKHPDRLLVYEPYHIQVGGTLMVSAITVLVTLFTLLVAVPVNKWVMSRKIGWGLIALWSVSTTVNLVLELTGWWGQMT